MTAAVKHTITQESIQNAIDALYSPVSDRGKRVDEEEEDDENEPDVSYASRRFMDQFLRQKTVNIVGYHASEEPREQMHGRTLIVGVRGTAGDGLGDAETENAKPSFQSAQVTTSCKRSFDKAEAALIKAGKKKAKVVTMPGNVKIDSTEALATTDRTPSIVALISTEPSKTNLKAKRRSRSDKIEANTRTQSPVTVKARKPFPEDEPTLKVIYPSQISKTSDSIPADGTGVITFPPATGDPALFLSAKQPYTNQKTYLLTTNKDRPIVFPKVKGPSKVHLELQKPIPKENDKYFRSRHVTYSAPCIYCHRTNHQSSQCHFAPRNLQFEFQTSKELPTGKFSAASFEQMLAEEQPNGIASSETKAVRPIPLRQKQPLHQERDQRKPTAPRSLLDRLAKDSAVSHNQKNMTPTLLPRSSIFSSSTISEPAKSKPPSMFDAVNNSFQTNWLHNYTSSYEEPDLNQKASSNKFNNKAIGDRIISTKSTGLVSRIGDMFNLK